MKHFGIALFFTIFCLILTSSVTLAATNDYPQIEQTYLSRLDSYRTAFADWQTARQKYFDFKTLTAETAAVRAGSLYLTSSLNLIQAYLEILSNKASVSKGLGSGDQSYINDYYQKETAYVNQVKAQINSATTMAELTIISQSLDNNVRNDTLAKIPVIRGIIVSSDYRAHLEGLNSSLINTKNITASQNFLGGPTRELINTWLSDTETKIYASGELLKTITLDLREYKDDVKEKRKSLSDINERIRLLRENLISHSNNLLEILGRLQHD